MKFLKSWEGKSGLKYLTVLVGGILLRFIPFRAPNLEPVMASTLPFAKKYGRINAFFFAFLSMVLFDILDGKVGPWTWITAIVYGGIGIGAYYFLKNKSAQPLNFLTCSIIGTIVYDALTGLTIGPIFFNQTFAVALAGQIPFTLIHLVGNSVMALAVSPLIYRWLVLNPKLKTQNAKNYLAVDRL